MDTHRCVLVCLDYHYALLQKRPSIAVCVLYMDYVWTTHGLHMDLAMQVYMDHA